MVVHEPATDILHDTACEDKGTGEAREKELRGPAPLKVPDNQTPDHSQGETVCKEGQDLELRG